MTRLKTLFAVGLVLLVTIPAGLVLAQAPEDQPKAEGSGTAVISDDNALSDRITYDMTGVTPPRPGMVYKGWLVSDDGTSFLSTGVMTVSEEGTIQHTFTAPDGRNLIHNYSQVVITEESEGATGDSPQGDPVFSHQIPADAILHIRHLLTNWPPGTDKGIITRLQEQLDAAITHANLALNSTTNDDVTLHTHHVINIIEGEGGDNFDATFGNPGDGTGVLTHASDAIKHATFTMDAAPNDPSIQENGANVVLAAQNSQGWATEARDLALTVLDLKDINNRKTLLTQVKGFLEAARMGLDADRDGSVEYTAGEAGADQAYVAAQLMATYRLRPAIPALVVTPTAIPTPTATPTVTPTPEPTPTPVVAPGLPSVGDSSIPAAAQLALFGGLALLFLGGLLVVRGRRSPGNGA